METKEFKGMHLISDVNATEAENAFFDKMPKYLKESLPPELEEILRLQYRAAFRDGAEQAHAAICRALTDAGFPTGGSVHNVVLRKRDVGDGLKS